MRNPWIAAGLSLATIAGGHFYNGRPYKAFLFVFAFLLLSNLAAIALPLLLPMFTQTVPDLMRLTTRVTAVFLALVVLVSALVSYLDARRTAPEGGGLKFTSAVIASAFGGLLIAITGATLLSMHFLSS